MIVFAATQAQKAVDHILGKALERDESTEPAGVSGTRRVPLFISAPQPGMQVRLLNSDAPPPPP